MGKGIEELRAIGGETCEAWLTVLDATGGYPITRDDILHSIEEGVRKAVADWLAVNGLPGTEPLGGACQTDPRGKQ